MTHDQATHKLVNLKIMFPQESEDEYRSSEIKTSRLIYDLNQIFYDLMTVLTNKK